jgi:hypothetical protein
MAVFCNFGSVIIRRDSIEKYFQGGWTRFVLELPNLRMCSDGEVVNVRFMNLDSSQKYIDFLKSEGLQYENSSNDQSKIRTINDIDTLDHLNIHNEERDWIEFGDRKFKDREYFCCWFKDSSIDTLAFPISAPSGGDVLRLPRHIEPDEFKERFSFLRTENGLDIYLEKYPQSPGVLFLPENMDIVSHYNYFLKIKKDQQAKKEEKKRLLAKEAEKLKKYQLKEKSLRRSNGKLHFEQKWKGDLLIRKIYHYDGKLESEEVLDKNGVRISFEYFRHDSYRFFTNDIVPEDFSGQIGKILKEYIENPLNPQKKEKREILNRLYKESTKQGYIFFGGYSHNFGISRVGDSYIYDVPAKKTGNLREFRNQKIRVICVGSGTRWIRTYLAGPLKQSK